jgi:hypothetical protein
MPLVTGNGPTISRRLWPPSLCLVATTNFLTPDDHEQAESAYRNNARRLRDLKRKFDPNNIFSSAIPLA